MQVSVELVWFGKGKLVCGGEFVFKIDVLVVYDNFGILLVVVSVFIIFVVIIIEGQGMFWVEVFNLIFEGFGVQVGVYWVYENVIEVVVDLQVKGYSKVLIWMCGNFYQVVLGLFESCEVVVVYWDNFCCKYKLCGFVMFIM